jgi:3-oxoacyl-[acyl-carrier protein] reductase
MAAKELERRVALVTGGSRGIGRATCVSLAREGARVAVNYARNRAAAEETLRLVEAEGAEGVIVEADIAEPDEVTRMVGTVESALGPIDLLVANAGVPEVGTHEEIDFAAWRRTMAVNLDGTFLSIMAVKDGMLARGFGRIVCIASIAGLRPRPTMIGYGTSKAGVIALARNLAEALAPTIRINTVAPGLIDTDMPAGSLTPEVRQRMIEATPLKRIGAAEDIAEMALFLLSERAAFITGQTFVVDGGRVTLP